VYNFVPSSCHATAFSHLQAKEKGQLSEDLTTSQAAEAALTQQLQGSQAEVARLSEGSAKVAEELGATKGQLAAREVRRAGDDARIGQVHAHTHMHVRTYTHCGGAGGHQRPTGVRGPQCPDGLEACKHV